MPELLTRVRLTRPLPGWDAESRGQAGVPAGALGVVVLGRADGRLRVGILGEGLGYRFFVEVWPEDLEAAESPS